MPAIAIVGAGMSISAGVAAGVTTLVGGLQVAAGVLTIAGAVTGNKKLMILGSIASLGAGVANWASAGSSAASGAADAAGAATTAGETLSKAALDGTNSFGANSAAGAFDVTSGLGGAVEAADTAGFMGPQDFMGPPDALAGNASTLGTEAAPVDLDKAAGDYFGGADKAAEEGIISKAVNQDGTSAATDELTSTATETPADELAKETGGKATEEIAQDKSVLKGKGGAGTESTAGGFKEKATALMDFINDKKNAGVVKLGSGLVSGIAQSYGQQSAAKAAIKVREEALARDRERLNTSISGLNRFK